jgi:hypothetical protein
LEQWFADGIFGKSAVFLTHDVAGKSDAELQSFLAKHGEADLGGATVSRTPDHVFVNFGFET